MLKQETNKHTECRLIYSSQSVNYPKNWFPHENGWIKSKVAAAIEGLFQNLASSFLHTQSAKEIKEASYFCLLHRFSDTQLNSSNVIH